MAILDLIILAVIAWQVWRGFNIGLISSVVGTVGWFIVLLLSIKLSPSIAPLFAGVVSQPVLQVSLSFILLLIVMMTVLWIVEKLLKQLFQKDVFTIFEKIGGALFGVVKGTFIVLLVLGSIVPWFKNSPFIENTSLAKALAEYAPSAVEISKKVAKDAFGMLKTEQQNTEQATAELGQTDATVESAPLNESVSESRSF